MKRITSVFALAVLGPAWGQTPQWRAVEVPIPTGLSGFAQLNDGGDLLFYNATSQRFIKNASGALFQAPPGWVRGDLRADGKVFGKLGSSAGLWTPGQGVFSFPGSSGMDPVVSHPVGGAIGSIFGTGSSGVDTYYLLSSSGTPTLVAGTSGPGFLNHINRHGVISGQLGERFGAGSNPGIWTNGGQTFNPRSAPGMRFGSVLFTDDNGVSFGRISRSGAQAGWYNVWWNPDGTLLREQFHEPLFQNNLSFLLSPWVASTSDGRFIDRFIPPGQSGSQAQVRYWSATTGFINIENHVTGLPSGYRIFDHGQVTDGGRIVVRLININNPDDQRYNYYLEPVPEPATLTGLALGLGWLARRRKRRA